MKRFITLLLAIVLTLSLCACGASTNTDGANSGAASKGLKVGYSKVNLTPSYSVSLGGYGDEDTRRSEGFVTYIFMTCIAVSSGSDTFLLYTFDGLNAPKSIQDKMRASILNVVSIPTDHIFIGATHSHSAPVLNKTFPGNDQYYDDFFANAAKAAQEAIADQSPATMLAGTTDIKDENGKYMNFVRHFKLEDGTHAGSGFGDNTKEAVGYSAENDPQMVLVKFDITDKSKKDILMVNWQAHPDNGSELGRTLLAASWVGPLRDELETLSGMRVAYFTGASGNQNMSSRIQKDTHNLDWKTYGQKVAQIANNALVQLKPVEGTELKQTKRDVLLDIDHSWDHMLEQANEVYDLWKSAGKTAGDNLGKQYGFTSSYQANAIRNRANKPATETLETRVFKIGSVGFTTGTYEMFSTQGLYVKRNSPFEITFIIAGNFTYLPDRPAYEYRSYEADTGYYAPGSAEKLAENYVEMLKEIK